MHSVAVSSAHVQNRYKLYNVTRENKLYLPPEKRTRIW